MLKLVFGKCGQKNKLCNCCDNRESAGSSVKQEENIPVKDDNLMDPTDKPVGKKTAPKLEVTYCWGAAMLIEWKSTLFAYLKCYVLYCSPRLLDHPHETTLYFRPQILARV